MSLWVIWSFEDYAEDIFIHIIELFERSGFMVYFLLNLCMLWVGIEVNCLSDSKNEWELCRHEQDLFLIFLKIYKFFFKLYENWGVIKYVPK